MLGPTSPLMPEQASLFRSGVPVGAPLGGHSLWGLALITPGSARSYLFYFNIILGQGCPLSRTLFGIFIYGLHSHLDSAAPHAGVQFGLRERGVLPGVC